jgi:hypothetical protein
MAQRQKLDYLIPDAFIEVLIEAFTGHLPREREDRFREWHSPTK